MPMQVILSQSGPLPITANFESPGDEPMYLEVNGSVWTQTPNTMIGIGIQIDGQSALGYGQIYSNAPATHRAVVPAYVQVQLQPGTHKLVLYQMDSNTTCDGNDFYTAVLHY